MIYSSIYTPSHCDIRNLLLEKKRKRRKRNVGNDIMCGKIVVAVRTDILGLNPEYTT